MTVAADAPRTGTDWFDRIRVIDVDAHVTEPPDLWTSRVPSKWANLAPHVERVDGTDVWVAGDGAYRSVPGMTATAGTPWIFPGPSTYDDMHPAAWQSDARLQVLDQLGVYAQVLYPNVGGFGHGLWAQMEDREFAVTCVRAYNDFMVEFCSADPDRLLPTVAVPFWDISAAVAEVERCLAAGHRAINFTSNPDTFGLPHIWEHHWDPLWSLATEARASVNFHIASGNMMASATPVTGIDGAANIARTTSMLFTNNLRCISDLIHGGVCHRFPELQFVSVESGVGFLPMALEYMDWQWRHIGVRSQHPEYDLLPSEYFRRQIYGCFWFERHALGSAVEAFPDNLLYETDFPHSAAQYPADGTPAVFPREYVRKEMADFPDAVVRKLLSENAAGIYHVDVGTGAR